MLCIKNKCSRQTRKEPHTAIVVAFFRELEQMLELAKVKSECRVGLRKYYILKHRGKEFILFASGVGLRRARWSTKAALRHFNIQSLVLSGIAANLEHGNKVGDTLVAKEWLSIETGKKEKVSEQLLKKAQRKEDIKIVGSGATSNYFITDTSHLPQNISCIDMETYEIARVTRKNNVPFIAFRTLSDHGDGKETAGDFDKAARMSARKVLDFVTT